jgi:hypothetical protein
MSDLTAPISAEEFSNAKALVIDVLAERDPTIDLTDGSAVVGLVVENEAHMTAVHVANYDALNKSFSLKAIADNLIDVDDALVDSLVSNYFITRRDASPASGPVRVVVNLNVLYILPQDYAFVAGGVTYKMGTPVRVLRAGSQVAQTPTQRVLIPRADGRFEFTVDVVADTPGSAGLISAGTAMEIPSPLDGFETASAAVDFTGGEDRETNADLLARAQAGITAQTLAGPAHIQAALEAQFAGIRTAVLGIGSPLMTRDRGNLFGISTGATEDIWVKTTAFPGSVEVTVAVVAPPSGRTMSFTIVGEDAAGVYRVRFIRRASTAGVQGDAPDVVVPMKRPVVGFSPKTPKPADLWFGAIADLRVTFTDTSDAPLVPGTTYAYTVEVFRMPTVDAVSTYVYDPSVRLVGTDYYVRAGIPCMVELEIELGVRRGDPRPEVEDVQEAVAAAVNGLAFGTSRLTPYTIHTALAPLLGRSDVRSLQMRGTIYAPTADVHLVLGNALTIPDSPAQGFSAANTFFACSPANVGVTIVS